MVGRTKRQPWSIENIPPVLHALHRRHQCRASGRVHFVQHVDDEKRLRCSPLHQGSSGRYRKPPGISRRRRGPRDANHRHSGIARATSSRNPRPARPVLPPRQWNNWRNCRRTGKSQPILRAVCRMIVVSLTIVPTMIMSQPASRRRVICALKSVSVGRCAGDSGKFHAHRLGLCDDTGIKILAEIGVLIHRAELLLAQPFGKILHRGAHLIVIGRELAEFIFTERLEHRACAGQRKNIRHLLLDHGRQHRVHVRRATATDRDEDVVAVDQLVHRLHRFRDQILVVLDNETDLPPGDAAACIDVVESQADRFGGVAALNRGDARTDRSSCR